MKIDLQSHWCERLYAQHAAELLLYGRALGLSHSEAEDVLHDAFVSLLRRWSKRPLRSREDVACALEHAREKRKRARKRTWKTREERQAEKTRERKAPPKGRARVIRAVGGNKPGSHSS